MPTQIADSIPAQDWRHITGRRSVSSEEFGSNGTGLWDKVMRELEAMRELEDDWDGLGARGPTAEIIDSAIGLAHLLHGRSMDAPTRVVPGPEGTVILEWQDPDGSYSEVEVVRPFYAEVMAIEPGKPARHWVLPDA